MAGAQPRFPALDGLRALGALAVLTTHVGFSSGASLIGAWAGPLARLDAGVAVFFVISGFLLYRPHVVARLEGLASPAPGVYLWHRALRILPVLWIAVALALVLRGDGNAGLSGYLQVATLTQIYADGFQVPGLTQMWSLATEVAFYLVLPWLARVLALVGGRSTPGLRREMAALIALGAFSVVWWAVVAEGGTTMGLWLPGYLGWFGAGMALAVWSAGRERDLLAPGPLDDLAAAPGTAWVAAMALFLVAATPIAGPYGLQLPTTGTAVTKNVLYAGIAFLIVLPAVAAPATCPSRRVVDVLGSGVPRYLGQISYGIFAYHVALLGLVERVIGHKTFGGQFFLLWTATLGVSVAFASVSFYVVERPVIRWGRRREPRRRTSAKAMTTSA
jgi:peptidoglycan/LPS O-acetylase OafA/YrhL